MHVQEFYKRVLPREGFYCAAALELGEDTQHRFAKNVKALIEHIDRFAKRDHVNVYFTPLSFKGYSRSKDNALFARSFFVDIDVKHGRQFYLTREAALTALDVFLDKTGLPEPVRISSGVGIQAYWVFDTDVPVSQWLPYARKFKDFCVDQGLLIDPAITVDAARIMRAPGTFNWRTGQPLPASVLSDDIAEYSFADFQTFLGPVISELNGFILHDIPKGMDADTAAVAASQLENFQASFEKIAVRSLQGSGCNQIKHILTNAATLDQPMWHSGLSIARHCTDWETAIHLMSEDYPGYSAEATLRKANETLNKPHGCEVFEDRNPGGCDGCPHRGKITNPLALGRVVAALPAKDPFGAQGAAPQTDIEWPSEPYLKGFSLGVKGGVIYQPPPTFDKESKTNVPSDPVIIAAESFFPVKRVFDPLLGESLIVRCLLRKDPVREAVLPLKHAIDRQSLLEFLASLGASPEPAAGAYLVRYMKNWRDYLAEQDMAEQLRAQMGWAEDNSSFVLGNSELLADGTERVTAASPMIRNVAKLVQPHGERRLWEGAVAKLNKPQYELHAFGLLCGFGSPLMRFLPVPGAAFCFTNSDSGTGKSGALFAAVSVWGDPPQLSLMESSATDNAFIGRMLNLKNIPFAIDELTTTKIEELPKLLHRLSQGRPKARMQATINAERDIEMPASMIALMSSNRSIYDSLYALKGSPDGEVARVLQFELLKPDDMTNEVGASIFEVVKHNYGFAGPDFIRHLFKIGDAKVQEVINRWKARVEQNLGTKPAHRFYAAGITAAFAGGELAMNANLIKLDLDRIFNRVMVATIEATTTGGAKINNTDYNAIYGEFINENIDRLLIVDGTRPVYEPRMAVVGRIEIDTARQYISRRSLREYLSKRTINATSFENALEADGILIKRNTKQRLTSGWKAGGVTPAVPTYEMKNMLSSEEIDELKSARA